MEALGRPLLADLLGRREPVSHFQRQDLIVRYVGRCQLNNSSLKSTPLTQQLLIP